LKFLMSLLSNLRKSLNRFEMSHLRPGSRQRRREVRARIMRSEGEMVTTISARLPTHPGTLSPAACSVTPPLLAGGDNVGREQGAGADVRARARVRVDVRRRKFTRGINAEDVFGILGREAQQCPVTPLLCRRLRIHHHLRAGGAGGRDAATR